MDTLITIAMWHICIVYLVVQIAIILGLIKTWWTGELWDEGIVIGICAIIAGILVGPFAILAGVAALKKNRQIIIVNKFSTKAPETSETPKT